ncbi:hypothetical protein JTB14_010491 [Gonioctena quinquepunctata]|nr:hypothetical protein JTB14_010491 [Gonioctena quinquepunctata]
MNQYYEAFFPIKKVPINRNESSKIKWFNDDLRNMREQLHSLKVLAKSTNCQELKDQVKSTRKNYKLEIKKAKISANTQFIENSSNKVKAAWQIINQNKTVNKQSTRVSECPSAEDFNEYFANIAESIINTIPYSNTPNHLLEPLNMFYYTMNAAHCSFMLHEELTFFRNISEVEASVIDHDTTTATSMAFTIVLLTLSSIGILTTCLLIIGLYRRMFIRLVPQLLVVAGKDMKYMVLAIIARIDGVGIVVVILTFHSMQRTPKEILLFMWIILARQNSTCPKCNGQRLGNYREGRQLNAFWTLCFLMLKKDERPYVTVSIFGEELLGLLDSGASHTILGNKGWKLLKDIGLSTLDRTGVSSVTVANGDKCECLGVLHVPVRVDFWVRMGIVPDLRSKEWKFTQVNGTFADIDAVEALHSRELLTSDQVEILDELVNDCFVRMGNSLGCTKIVEHKIELLDNGEPIKQRFYPVSPALMKHIDGELQDMLKKDVIEPSSSPWSSPIVMHIKILSMVFERLISAGLTLSQEKCKFCRRELQFLGYVVDENGLHVDPGKVEVILQIPTPSKISEVRSLIGTASWYRRFIPNFSTVIQPLTELLKKNTKHVDASGYGIGAVLTQNHPDVGERVVSYLSRSLTKQERKFSTTERECLAVIWSIEKLRPYIEGTHFTVVTDHWSLCWLNNLKDPTGRLGRWSLKLQQYSFDLVHRKGKENVVPDMLSRTVPIIDALDIAVNVDLGKSDKWYDRMLYDVDSNPLRFPTWRISDSKLYKYVQFKKIPGLDFHDDWKLVIPKNKRKDILLKCHDDPQAGHPGVFKTFKRVSEHFIGPK